MLFLTLNRVFIRALRAANDGHRASQACGLRRASRSTRLLVGDDGFLARSVLFGGERGQVCFCGTNAVATSGFEYREVLLGFEDEGLMRDGLVLVGLAVDGVVYLRGVCFLLGLLRRLFCRVLDDPSDGDVFVRSLGKEHEGVGAFSVSLTADGRDHGLIRRANSVF